MCAGRGATSDKPHDAALGHGRGEGRTMPVAACVSMQEPSDTCGAFQVFSCFLGGTQLTHFSCLACLIRSAALEKEMGGLPDLG